MAFRFWKRVKIAPGVSLNLSKSGASVSFGPRGSKFTIGPRGTRTTVGIPGTGIYYTKTQSTRRKSTTRSAQRSTRATGGRSASRHRHAATRDEPAVATVSPNDRLTPGFFRRLVTPPAERAFVDGCREFVQGNEKAAIRHLRKATHLADGAYLAGFLALKHRRWQTALECLETAAKKHQDLGKYFRKYQMSLYLSLPITDEITAHVGPTLRGTLLGLAEVYQRQRRWKDAIACLKRLLQLQPDDIVVKVSTAELLWEAAPGNKQACQSIVRLAARIDNTTAAHTALLWYKGKALRALGMLHAARDALTAALRRKKDRPAELLRAIRYDRALVYEELGQHSRARRELEKVYAEAPDYEDVAERLGL